PGRCRPVRSHRPLLRAGYSFLAAGPWAPRAEKAGRGAASGGYVDDRETERERGGVPDPQVVPARRAEGDCARYVGPAPRTDRDRGRNTGAGISEGNKGDLAGVVAGDVAVGV